MSLWLPAPCMAMSAMHEARITRIGAVDRRFDRDRSDIGSSLALIRPNRAAPRTLPDTDICTDARIWCPMMSDHDHPVDPERVERVRAADQGEVETQAVASLLTLLADPLRARILRGLLVVEELCVGDLALALDATEDAVTYALRILRTAGLVRRRRDGRMGMYRLSEGPAREALAATLATTRDLVQLHPELGPEEDE